MLAESGELEAALDAAQRSYRLAPTDPQILDTLGELYRRSGRVERSISFLEDARAGAPELEEARIHLALAYRDAGRNSDARAELRQLEASESTAGALRRQAQEVRDSLP